MILAIERLYAAHIEWLGLRRSLKGQQHRFFWRWLFEERKDLVEHVGTGDPVLLQKQCREIQQGSRAHRPVGISHGVLKRYAADLTRMYLATPIATRPPFIEWLQEVTATCLTETALRRHLGLV